MNTTTTQLSMRHRFNIEAQFSTASVDEIGKPQDYDKGHPASAPGQTQTEDEKNLQVTHHRIQFLRLSSVARTARGPAGATPPYQPAAPSLLRVASDEGETQVFCVPRGLSPLRNLAYTSHLPRATNKKMPHAINMPQTGFQALILCGPGIGLSTFTSVPKEFPKALVQIANRPMVWYVLDWCYRAGVTGITLITPPESKDAMAAALGQDPHLTSLPTPTPDLLAPRELEYETATAELLRLPQVQKIIRSDFLLLPCDLICDIQGETLLDTYLTRIGGLAGAGISTSEYGPKRPLTAGLGGESSGRRGGLSIWYNTANREESVKKEECDFMCSAKLNQEMTAPLASRSEAPGNLRNLVWTMPMSELKEQTEEDKSWRIRSSLLRKHGNVKCLTQYRDSHIYFLPYWIKQFAALNKDFESFSEDLIGTWAKAEWRKPAYRARFGSTELFPTTSLPTEDDAPLDRPVEDEINLLSLSSTQTVLPPPKSNTELKFASRVQPPKLDDSILSDPSNDPNDSATNTSASITPLFPPIAAYILPSAPTAPLVRRVDTTPLLLSVSLLLAKLPSHEDDTKAGSIASSPFAHPSKVHPTATVAPQVTISKSDSLVGANTAIATRCVIKNSVIGANVTIGSRTRITGSVIMDGATVGEGCELNGTVVGKRVKIGGAAKLTGCEVQDGNVMGEGVEGKGEKFLVGGLGGEDDEEGFEDEGEGGEGDGEGLSLMG